MWTDSAGGSLHPEGHRVAVFGGYGIPKEWWFYPRGYRRERLQSVGPEPLGPFPTLEAAKAAGEAFIEVPAAFS